MADPALTFAAFSLELLSPLHLGSRRAGVVARTHHHAPGHVFVHALAAAVGAKRGTGPEVFAAALEEISQRFRFGPAFFIEGGRRIASADFSARLLHSTSHVTLGLDTRAALDSALFEVEAIQTPPRGTIRLGGGVWFDRDGLDGKPLKEWLSVIRLGGELKTGFGRVRCTDWQAGANAYPGIGAAGPQGVVCKAGDILPGATIDGVAGSPLTPLVGRRHDAKLGFGRRLSQAALVRVDGRVQRDSLFLPVACEPGLGCWTASP
jgi:hypothetical protein